MSSEKPRRSQLTVYVVEVALGIVLTLAFLMIVLLALGRVFPGATDLGELVRRRDAGRQLIFRPGTPDGPVAKLSSVSGEVRDKPAASVIWSVSEKGAALGDHHAVQTYKAAGAHIFFDESRELELGEKSVIVVQKPVRPKGAKRRRAPVLFLDGFLRGRLSGADNELELEIHAAGGTVRSRSEEGGEPAEIALSMDSKRSSLAVYDGTAEVAWNDTTTAVPAGYMVTFDEERAPGDPVPLPEAPLPLSPSEGERFFYRASPPRVTFVWTARGDPSGYRVQIARDANFERVIYRGTQPESTFVYGNLETGDYFWRVTAIRQGIPGVPGPAARFEVVRDEEPPRLDVEFPRGPVAQERVVLSGTVEPGCRVFINDVGVTTDSTGRFTHTLQLTQGYNFVVVQAIDPTGNTAFENHTVVADLVPSEEKP